MRVVLFVWSLVLSNLIWSQTLLLTEDFSGGIPGTWTVIDVDGNTPNADVNYVNNAWVGFENDFDTCAISTSYYTDESMSSEDYLISPAINVLTYGNILSWDAKSFDASYPDSYVVLISTTDNQPASFTDTLLMINNESPYWTNRSVDMAQLGFANQTVYVAFKNITTNGYLLGLDNIKVVGDDPATVQEVNSEINIYPNPVADFLNIQIDESFTANIYRLDGSLIYSGKQKQINVQQFVNGVYFIRIYTQKAVIEQKIIIAK